MRYSTRAVYWKVESGMIRTASLLVPATARAEWLREWRGELWHVRHASSTGTREHLDAETWILRFCLGSFLDALCLRRMALRGIMPLRRFRGSAAHCLLSLTALLAGSYVVALYLPGVQAESHASRYNVRRGLILIEDSLASNDAAATVPLDRYRKWKASKQRYFDDFAFYRTSKDSASAGASGAEIWNVAHASLNLFSLLGLPIQHAARNEHPSDRLPEVILSNRLWKTGFAANPHIAGSLVRIGATQATVMGVAPEGAWRLPGSVDAWLLETDRDLGGVGYIIAHLTALGRSEMLSSRVPIASYDPQDGDDTLWGISFAERTEGPGSMYRFAIFLAFLALPAITSVAMSEYSFSSQRPSWRRRLLRWAFLLTKISLLLPIVYFVSLDVAYCRTTSYSIPAQYAQLILSFSLCLFGLRWALLDQRHRCPVCLRRVTHPARVGLAGRTFLAWNGTEMICTGGHTLLHVPGLPTSWFSTQRWLYLDTSWRCLFVGSELG